MGNAGPAVPTHKKLRIPYTMVAVKDCPLQLSLRADYRYPLLWYGVQNTPVGQRVNTTIVLNCSFMKFKLFPTNTPTFGH